MRVISLERKEVSMNFILLQLHKLKPQVCDRKCQSKKISSPSWIIYGAYFSEKKTELFNALIIITNIWNSYARGSGKLVKTWSRVTDESALFSLLLDCKM